MPSELDSVSYEAQHVHSVYDRIAPHFSSTRYKPWPTPQAFLTALAPGSVGLDVGCGNGKYLSVNPNIYILGSDRSAPLVDIASANHAAPDFHLGVRGEARERMRTGHAEALVADSLMLPHPKGTVDFVISIAVLHHLSTRERRLAGMREMLELLRPPGPGREGGRVLIFVWALEQQNSRRGWKDGDEQDVLVPWVLNEKRADRKHREQHLHKATAEREEPKVFERFYHLYRQGELEDEVDTAGGAIVQAGYEKDNWWCIAIRKE